MLNHGKNVEFLLASYYFFEHRSPSFSRDMIHEYYIYVCVFVCVCVLLYGLLAKAWPCSAVEHQTLLPAALPECCLAAGLLPCQDAGAGRKWEQDGR